MNHRRPTMQILVEFSYLLTIIIGISSCIELCRQLMAKNVLHKKFTFRYLLFLKAVSDIVVLMLAFGSFCLQFSNDRSAAWSNQHSHYIFVVATYASFVSTLISITYSTLRLWLPAQHKNTVNIISTFIFLFIAALIAIKLLKSLDVASAPVLFISLFSLLKFWAFMIVLSIFLLFVFLFYYELDLKETVSRLVSNMSNKKENFPAIGVQQQDFTKIKTTSMNTINNSSRTKDSNIAVTTSSRDYNSARINSLNAKTKTLFLFGVVLVSVLLNCIFLFQEASRFSSDMVAAYSFFTTSSLLVVRLIQENDRSLKNISASNTP